MTNATDLTEQIITFAVNLPHRSLRRNSETRSTNWRAKLRREWQEEIWCVGRPKIVSGYTNARISPHTTMTQHIAFWMPWERATVRYVWCSIQPTDVDNIIATMKPALDVLKSTGPRPLGIIRDDGPGVTVEAVWEKARHRADEKVIITIRREP